VSQCQFVNHKSHTNEPGVNPDLRDERMVTNHLKHGTVQWGSKFYIPLYRSHQEHCQCYYHHLYRDSRRLRRRQLEMYCCTAHMPSNLLRPTAEHNRRTVGATAHSTSWYSISIQKRPHLVFGYTEQSCGQLPVHPCSARETPIDHCGAFVPLWAATTSTQSAPQGACHNILHIPHRIVLTTTGRPKLPRASLLSLRNQPRRNKYNTGSCYGVVS
jgi:hypothetical protein